MHPLNLTRIAFGCNDTGILRERLLAKAAGGETWIDTRYRPTRHVELIGGSLFWIIRHQLIARQAILGFDEVEGRCRIRLSTDLVPVRPRPRRAHQGWRYLVAADAPGDFDGADEELAAMPAPLASELAALGLI
ncbi:DUF1489 domain-containing protein [Sphingomonas bacterium]|uniref:DUF1489 domain-containing protein n=1 Tax=Sphingomonas bacterium TaxID=1895847 RepID=UPI001575C5B8|nr:DUF1489 domain-containing protein [Sphingomonas bacterium]